MENCLFPIARKETDKDAMIFVCNRRHFGKLPRFQTEPTTTLAASDRPALTSVARHLCYGNRYGLSAVDLLGFPPVKKLKCACLLAIATVAATAQSSGVSGERIRAHVKFLASDLLEGRAPGSRGGDLATEYIATQFALLGLKPAGDKGTYFQNFTLVGVEPQADAQLGFSPDKGAATSFKWLDDFV